MGSDYFALKITSQKCATKISYIGEWQENNCDKCIELEDELHFFSKSSDNYFKLRQNELETFENEVYPKLNEIFLENEDLINQYLTENYRE